MILKGINNAINELDKSNVAFISELILAEMEFFSPCVPPTDHYKLEFNHRDLITIRGRVYDRMKYFSYKQKVGVECVLPEPSDIQEDDIESFHPIKPTVGKIYLACVYNDVSHVDKLIELEKSEIDQVVKKANEKRRSSLC
ncbi:unnamed protein product [Didymodactylos carnosus]|uniref:Uncharacterized protein n=1 Tax=Didymodactylos carnosus TaxID=1234261 RepID=A0A815BBU4_9BILA|nr:unnamed protein product [Didymodactylos carnosus]CAF1269234.1 unnamed protein product [Didymodactylos carnosus]CAF4016700.1 unnamed protein product [Didymodactylos carnosus]CAF4055761.1 unnamed protein product [Didymodactylos carnosus]